MRVTVVGAGKMGLPLAAVFASHGARVSACDTDPSVVAAINAGAVPFIEPGLDELVARAVGEGRLLATTETVEAVAGSEVVVVIVPAKLTADHDADLSSLLAASGSIAKGLRPGMMVSYETTVPIGTTRNHLGRALAAGGLEAGRDFDLVFSPERVKSRRVLRNLTVNPKVVGGVTPASAERGSRFYSEYLAAPVANVGSLEAAEFVKLAGMIYRDVNIGIANQLAEYAEAIGVDMSELTEAINSDGEAALLLPGIGVGGHCTPVYPHFYLRDAMRRGIDAGIAGLARATNDAQSRRSLDRVESLWGPLGGQEVLVLGLGFRPEVKEDSYSPTYLLRDDLERRGARPLVHDPLYSDSEITARGLSPTSLERRPLPPVAVLVTGHRAYRDLRLDDLARHGVEVMVDGRNLWSKAEAADAGLVYIGMGRPVDPSRPRPVVVTPG